MFTRLHVRNFLSLRDVSIELGKVNVLVGPNASGKSNVARALQLVAKHARRGLPELDGYGALRDLSFNFDPIVNIEIALEALIEGTKYGFTLQLTNEKYVEQVLKGNEVIILHEGNASAFRFKGEYKSDVHLSSGLYYGVSVFKSILTTLPSYVGREIYLLASSLRNISVHSFSPGDLRLKSNIDAEPLLDYYGENLARHLLYLYTERRKDFMRVEEALKNMVPEVEEVIPHIEQTKVEVWIKVKGMDEPLKPHNISDGTLRLLAMITALYGGSSLVALEEPENCIHPHLLETFMHLVREAPSQVIIITHSPYLLDYVKPEEVYVVQKEGLETKVRMLSRAEEVEEVRRFLEDGGTLGEAWYSGMFGGVP
ncbi:MAG: AAA family ATPase [Candidatus Nezhaarchaeales archaeon]